MKDLLDLMKRNLKLLVCAILLMLFSVVVINNSNANQLKYNFPGENVNIQEIAFAGQELDESGIAFEFAFDGWDIGQLGLRFFADELTKDDVITIAMQDSQNHSFYGDYVLQNFETDEDGITWLPVNEHISAGNVTIIICSESINPVSVCVYTQEGVLDTDGNMKNNLNMQINAASYPKRNAYLFSFICILLVTVLFIAASEKAIQYERLFIYLYLLLGILSFCVFPVFTEPDSGNHYRRAYALSEGDVFPEVDENNTISGYFSWPETWGTEDGVSISRYEMKNRVDFSVKDQASEKKLSYTNMALYSPLSHFVPALSMAITRLFTDKMIIIAMLARIANFIVTGIILFLAIKIIPFGKKYIIWTVLMPFVMKLYTSISPDIMIVGLVCLLTAIVLRLRYDKYVIADGKYLAAIYIVSFLLGQFKIVYVAFCLLLFLIPMEKFGNRKRYFIHVIGVGVVTLLPALGWFLISSNILKQGYASSSSVNTLILLNPLKFLPILARTFVVKGYEYMQQFFGYTLGIKEGINVTIFFVNFAFVMYLTGKNILKKQMNQSWIAEKQKKDVKMKGIFCAAMGITVFLIFGAEYVQWTQPASEIIDGVQGRYFFPFTVPFLTLLCGVADLKAEGNEVAESNDYFELFILSLMAIGFFSWMFIGYQFS